MDACCKVGKLIQEYELQQAVSSQNIEEYLVARWLGNEEYPATGLRPLKDLFNRRIIKSVYTDHGRSTLDSRVESEYKTLDGDKSAVALLEDLKADGIDGKQLQSDFISTATLYRHFTQCLDISKPKTESSNSHWEGDKIRHTEDVAQSNIRDSLQSLANKGRLPLGDRADIHLDIVLGCPECSTRVSITRALERGYICETHSDTETRDSSVDRAQSG